MPRSPKEMREDLVRAAQSQSAPAAVHRAVADLSGVPPTPSATTSTGIVLKLVIGLLLISGGAALYRWGFAKSDDKGAREDTQVVNALGEPPPLKTWQDVTRTPAVAATSLSSSSQQTSSVALKNFPQPATRKPTRKPAVSSAASTGAKTPRASTAPPLSEPKLKPVGIGAQIGTLPQASTAPPGETVANPGLAEEARLVEKMRSHVEARRWSNASADLAVYRRKFRQRGQLAVEAMALEIEILIGQGRKASATALASRFAKRYPSHRANKRIGTLISRMNQSAGSDK